MRTIFFLLVSITFIFSGCKTQKDPAVVALKKAEQEMKFSKAVQALTNQEFVLEADRITFKNGRHTYVSPHTNFVSLTGDQATIQLAFNSAYAGPNGMGGITLDGKASNIKIKEDKKGNITYSMNVMGTGVSAVVTFNLIKDTNQCSATVTPNFNNRVINFSGYLYPKSESDVFKGRSL